MYLFYLSLLMMFCECCHVERTEIHFLSLGKCKGFFIKTELAEDHPLQGAGLSCI